MGLAYLLKIIFEIGLLELLIQVRQMQWGFAMIMLIAFAEFFFHAWAWTYTFPVGAKPFHFFRLFRLWLGANAIKSLNPLGNVGGETYRLMILMKAMSKKDATASMTLDIFSHGHTELRGVVIKMRRIHDFAKRHRLAFVVGHLDAHHRAPWNWGDHAYLVHFHGHR